MKIIAILSVILLTSCGYEPRKTDSHDVINGCEDCKPRPYYYEPVEPQEPPMPPQYPGQTPCNERVNVDADRDNADRNSNRNRNINLNNNYNSVDCGDSYTEETNQNEPRVPGKNKKKKCKKRRRHEKDTSCKYRA